jgi:hypothetical protein
LAKRFTGNVLIIETWNAMANDFLQLGESLRALPKASTVFAKEDEKAFLTELSDLSSLIAAKVSRDGTLQEHMSRALDLEERLTKKIYAPLIYRLKSNWTARYSDFYILVKAHITRLNRLILPCAGDPILIQRTIALLEGFEQEVQRPRELDEVVRRSPRPSRRKAKASSKKVSPKKVSAKKVSKVKGRVARPKAPKPASSATKRAKRVTKRSKRLIKNIKVSRRRASR